jgi:hypothetical protein
MGGVADARLRINLAVIAAASCRWSSRFPPVVVPLWSMSRAMLIVRSACPQPS